MLHPFQQAAKFYNATSYPFRQSQFFSTGVCLSLACEYITHYLRSVGTDGPFFLLQSQIYFEIIQARQHFFANQFPREQYPKIMHANPVNTLLLALKNFFASTRLAIKKWNLQPDSAESTLYKYIMNSCTEPYGILIDFINHDKNLPGHAIAFVQQSFSGKTYYRVFDANFGEFITNLFLSEKLSILSGSIEEIDYVLDRKIYISIKTIIDYLQEIHAYYRAEGYQAVEYYFIHPFIHV